MQLAEEMWELAVQESGKAINHSEKVQRAFHSYGLVFLKLHVHVEQMIETRDEHSSDLHWEIEAPISRLSVQVCQSLTAARAQASGAHCVFIVAPRSSALPRESDCDSWQ